ncbi:MAG TPA: S8 family serine peptidase [Pyrinomonadaceae bacterium]|nr:S8 family serine peptidase [Pyrinomonadaceae bacterium]
MSPQKTLDHPSFGPSELVPGIVAIRWARQLAPAEARTFLSGNSLTLATEKPKDSPKDGTPDPRPVNVNQSETLSWVSGKSFSDAALTKLTADENIEWVAPVYRAVKADAGPQSYFAINPTVLLLSPALLAAIGDIGEIDDAAAIDQRRSSLLKTYTVINLPNGNAIEVAERIKEKAGSAAVGGIKFENIPYISPLCSCCGDSAAHGDKRGKCSPAVADLIPNDTFYPNQWGLQRINAPRAWPISEGDPNVVIAVLDQGVELGHPDLNMWPISYSTVTHTNDGSPVGNHGTACAGIIGSHISNSMGVTGLAGKCRIMAIATNFADTEVAEGLYFAADNGARVVSMSFGVYPSWMIWDFAIIEAALQYCQSKNVLLVAATGNENQNVSRFPATDPTTLGVGGSNRADVRKAVGDTSIEGFWGACFGPDCDVVAPCLEIPTTDRLGAAGYTPTDYTQRFNGTSSATPHVAALGGLIMSVNPALTNLEVRKIISETTDKINAGAYVYAPTAGKPFGTWTDEVGYGRINAERALLVACSSGEACRDAGPCCVELPEPEACCVSPCDPPWRTDDNCMYWYETRFFRVPLGRDNPNTTFVPARQFIEFRITYEHKFCLLGKQHGPLLFTQTLLPGEKVTLYHSDRYRRITSETDRFSVQTTFMQYVSAVHQARVTNSLDVLSDRLVDVKSSSSVSAGGGLAGLLGLPSGSSSTQAHVTDHNQVRVGAVADSFDQSVRQSSLLVHAERSVVVSNYEDKEAVNITSRVIQNDNECRAVTYFIRKVVELYAVSTRVSDISYRIIADGVPPEWHSIDDLGWLPAAVRDQIKNTLKLLPRVGEVVEKPKPVSLPTDGTVYDPELAHCCSCEPQREAAISIRLEKQKAEAIMACLETQKLQLELERMRLLLQKGELGPFDSAGAAPAPAHEP